MKAGAHAGEVSVFPLIDTAPRAARPTVVLALILVNTLVFVWMTTLPPRALQAMLMEVALVPARYTHPAEALRVGLDPDNYWPFITHAFLHGGWLHLLTNMWFLWIFGPAMEARLGRVWFLVMYVGGAAAASLVELVAHADSTLPVLGASGAVAAVIAAYAFTYPHARVITVFLIVIFPLFFPVPAMLFAGIWFVLQVVQGTAEIAAPSMGGGVAWWAHIGGFAFGALFAITANRMGIGLQTRTTVYQGRRVPDVPLR